MVIDMYETIPNTNTSTSDILNNYFRANSYFGTSSLVHDLCSSNIVQFKYRMDYKKNNDTVDLRHYIRLFREILRSNCLEDLKNISKEYYAIHALLLPSAERHRERFSYIFNLFDNHEKNGVGNALIRYRVLEYFNKFHDAGELFETFMSGMGYSPNRVYTILKYFIDSGLIEIFIDENGKNGYLTISGKRHLEIIGNLWYIICIKTGMYIYRDLILTGSEARDKASEFISSEALLGFYSNHGWVSEDGFIEYLQNEEILERERIDRNLKDYNLFVNYRDMYDKLESPSLIIYYDIKYQLSRWNDRRKV